MNEGYLTLLLMLVALILFASGWKDIILRGITRTSLLLFFVFWAVAMRWSFHWHDWQIDGCVLLLSVTVVWGLRHTHGWLLRTHVLSVGLLLGSVAFFLKESLHVLPGLLLAGSTYTEAAFTGSLAAVLLRRPFAQLAALSLGLLTGDLLYGVSHHEHKPVRWGDAGFQDNWWEAVFLTRGISLLLEGAMSGLRRLWEHARSRGTTENASSDSEIAPGKEAEPDVGLAD
ncbi:hypothetical protein O9H85_10915 [Paenibacillus filicis]|uniref:Uncharacterized protein n=1 Tax=Paenibacillus gyeongsangnamensis TaxID=3388067 RepID=A0ABT4Q892_9BACL|nr:hypothetical protein [Paenibacillus filicis]MCZ8512920.1 hypothetical protein [Paenibacillus filicis]